ncbi:MAG TPA: hypothetical protein VF527_20530 [Pyrinomonadaceae bacterium]|jgi:hypothetical protein
MKRLIISVALNLLLLVATGFAQQPGAATTTTTTTTASTPEAAAIKAEAENCSRAFMNGDFGKVIDLTYPKLFELGGGRAKVLAEVETQMKELQNKGIKIISHAIGEPEQSVRAGGKLVAIVPIRLKMESPEYYIDLKSFWLAVSTDEGKLWRFVSGSSLDENILKVLLPEVAGKIKLPEVKQPAVERKPATP